MSQYAKRMARLAASIGREVTRPTDSQSMKVVQLFSEKPPYMRREIVDYYPQYHKYNRLMVKLRVAGLFRSEHDDFNDKMKLEKKLKGKGKPNKGEGKRQMKKKK